MFTKTFHYDLPSDRIAQTPACERDASRLLVLHRSSGEIEHRGFSDLPSYLTEGDLLVLNDSRVIPARLRGWKPSSGGEVEVLLVQENRINDWWSVLRPGKRVRPGTRIRFRSLSGQATDIKATVTEKNDEGHYRLRFEGVPNVLSQIERLGETPLPPYIARSGHPAEHDRDRYQTVYATPPGSVAAPTAGLHFTDRLLERIRARGVEVGFVTLHVGLGTFAPVKSNTVEEHVMHEEVFVLPDETATAIEATKDRGRRVIAVGTTSVRVLESVAVSGEGETRNPVRPSRGCTSIFIYPPFRFRIVDALLTNFHLPESTLLMLVSAFATPDSTSGIRTVLNAYRAAVEQRYRFYSYGDAMLLV